MTPALVSPPAWLLFLEQRRGEVEAALAEDLGRVRCRRARVEPAGDQVLVVIDGGGPDPAQTERLAEAFVLQLIEAASPGAGVAVTVTIAPTLRTA